ncbi:Integrator complex subunit 2 [Chytriomyces hyalinus]|nr:Integrator complex subunit 2 [Chytriomyces hyalinus]
MHPAAAATFVKQLAHKLNSVSEPNELQPMLQDLVTNQTNDYMLKQFLIIDIVKLLPFLFDEVSFLFSMERTIRMLTSRILPQIVTAILDNPGPDSAKLLLNLSIQFPQHALMLRNLLIQKGIYLHVALTIALEDRDSQKYIECLKQIVDSDLSHVTLMTGVFCHTNQLMDIVHLVRSVTDVQVALTPDGLSKLRLIFINNLLKEDEIARRSLIMRSVDVNMRDNGQSLENSSGMTVVYELLKAGIFVRSGIDIKTWVFESIKSYQPPYHPKYPDLIKRYIEVLLESSTFTQISEREVANCFIRGDAITPMRVVLLFQVLHFNERYFAKKTAPTGPDFIAVNPNCIEYTPALMDQLPINQVLGFIERPENREAFQPFYSSLMSLVVSQFPQIVTATAFLNAESLADEENIIPFEYQLGILYESMKKSGFHGALPPFLSFEICDSVLVAVFRRCAEDWATAVACLETLCAMDSSKLLNHLSCIVSTLFPLVLRDRIDERILDLFEKLFHRLDSVSPRELWLNTVNCWLSKYDESTHFGYIRHNVIHIGLPVTSIELIKKPLELFQCDSRVFQIPAVFSVFLHMLDCYLIASRQHYFHTFQIDVSQDKTQKLKETHLYALLELQETAAMQALLELCIPGADATSNAGKINRSACQFVHQRFVVSKKSMKLLHFQGYRDDLIDVTVEGIASMHVCFEFIGELLAQPQLEKQVFGVQLACKLCVKYPIPNRYEKVVIFDPSHDTYTMHHLNDSHNLALTILVPKMMALSNQIEDTVVGVPTIPQQQAFQQVSLEERAAKNQSLLKVVDSFRYLLEAFPSIVENVELFVNCEMEFSTMSLCLCPSPPHPSSARTTRITSPPIKETWAHAVLRVNLTDGLLPINSRNPPPNNIVTNTFSQQCIQMKYIGAYLLATLGGNETPSAKDIKKILSSVGIEAEDSRIENLLSELEGKNIADVIAEGTKKMASLPAGGAAAPAAAGSAAPAAGGAAAAAPKKEEKEEKEESDDDMGFGLFD